MKEPMKATELRIGNWVNYEGKPYQVDRIVPLEVSAMGDWNPCDDYDPIPLTPEILERAGFELPPTKTHYRIVSLDGYHLMVHNDDGITEPMDVALYSGGFYRQSLNHVKHLHQLQNLYHALTGEELQIDLK